MYVGDDGQIVVALPRELLERVPLVISAVVTTR
jgi:hypothetical protein